MRILISSLIAIIAIGALVSPLAAHAQGFIPCGYDGPDRNTTLDEAEQCGFDDLITMIQNILTWLIYIAVPISGLMFAYAGWLYMSARGDSGQISQAHQVFVNVAIGLALLVGAWVIVWTVANALFEGDEYFRFLGD